MYHFGDFSPVWSRAVDEGGSSSSFCSFELRRITGEGVETTMVREMISKIWPRSRIPHRIEDHVHVYDSPAHTLFTLVIVMVLGSVGRVVAPRFLRDDLNVHWECVGGSNVYGKLERI